jgi:hypothetical protein
MTQSATGGASAKGQSRSAEVIEKYGQCLDLIGIDPHFREITVGLYLKDDIATIWSFSVLEGVDERIRQIRDLFVTRGGLSPVEGVHNQARFTCGVFHAKPMRFLLRNAVEKDPALPTPDGRITVKDIKSPVTFVVTPSEEGGRWVYTVTAEGESPRAEARVKAVVGGFMRYGDMERIEPTRGSFSCGARHDELLRLLLPSARNVSGSRDAMAAEDMRGQLTTQTLGYSQ